MLKQRPARDWREERRQSARDAIVASAWELVAEEGLAGLSLRDLAARAGITTPTVYAYFASKNAIYDAMFGQAAATFLDHMTAPFDTTDPDEVLVEHARRFVAFSAEDQPRFQLLFQRTIPGFEPSEESYEPAVRALADTKARLRRCGVGGSRRTDLWTALMLGLVAQQNANEPGGDRWTRLVDEATAMFLAHARRPQGDKA